MAQITIAVPTVPKDWHSTALGIIGAIGKLLHEYLLTGTFTLEGVAIAIFIAIALYMVPAKVSPADEAKLVTTITGLVNTAVGTKIPSVLTTERTVNSVEQAAVDTAAAQAPPA